MQDKLLIFNEKAKIINERPVVFCAVMALCLNLIVEILSRRSILEGLGYFMENPFVFVVNAMIIFLTLSISFLFKRRMFFLIAISAVWLGLGIANFIILGHRNTPLGALDFKLLKSVFSILNVYLSTTQMVLIGAALVVVLTIATVSWKKAPKEKGSHVRSISTFLISTIMVVVVMGVSIKGEALATDFGNVVDAYDQYGFAYCFSCSVVASGINKPDNYTPAKISLLMDDLQAEMTNTPEKTPNIIMLQLESFFDPTYLKDLTFSESPIPFFQSLRENYSSGFLTVPGVGAGTANTEFEVLTGMNLDFFGPGEYPYATILLSSTCESVNYNLKELEYKTHAIHNHTGTFYTRHEVYPHLGFDDFTPIECMGNIVRNPLDWAKDSMLVREIRDVLNSTEGHDFIYTVSVQGHGKYPTEVIDETQTITVGGIEDEGETIAMEYFVNQLKEMDDFLLSLTDYLEGYDEDVVLVLYGDHLPGLDIQPEELENGNIYQTEYVIWSNFPMEKQNKDLYTYQLTSEVLGRLGMNNGVLTKLHQQNSADFDYQSQLKLLQYDMLYGSQVSYGWSNPYQKTNMKFGTEIPKITAVSRSTDTLHIKGGDFNKWTKVFLNDEKISSAEILDQHTVLVTDIEPKDGDVLVVKQVGKSSTIYTESQPYIL